MQKHFTFLAPLAFVAALALPATAQDTVTLDPSTVVATVGDTEITVGHMIVAWASLPEQYQGLPDDVLFQGILDQLVQQSALEQKFDGELPARIPLQLENERRSLTAGEAINQLMEEPLDEADVQAAYEADYGNAEQETEYNASHILVETEEAALAVIEEIEGGADFAAVAREKSTGPSGPNGGQLGWFGTGAMVPEFEQAVVELEVGAVSAPVKTQFGWHIVQVLGRRDYDVTDETRRDQARKAVRDEKAEEALSAYLRRLRDEAYIELRLDDETN